MNSRETTIASLIAAAAFFASLFYAFFAFQDSLDNERQKNQQTLNALFQQYMRQLETTAYDYTYWNETLEKAVVEQDPEWADRNIGHYLIETFQVQNSYLFNHDNKVLFAFGIEHEKMLEALRTAPAFIDAVRKTTQRKRQDAKAESFYLTQGNAVFRVAVSAVTREEEEGERTVAEKAYLALIKTIPQSELDKIAKDFYITGLSWKADNQASSLNVIGREGQTVFQLYYLSDKNFIAENGWNLIPLLVTLLSLLYLIALVQRKVMQAQALNDTLATFNERLEVQVKEKTEQLLLKTQKAEEASEAKSVFLSNMSHEFRTPLNGILGFTQMLRMNNSKNLTDKQLSWLEQVFNAGSLLLEIVNDVLDLARIESGRVEYVPETFQPRVVFKECYDIIKPMAEAKQISLRGIPETDLYVFVDRAKLKQVLLNLVSNAVKYGKVGGHVTFGCRGLSTDKIELYVQDDGIGIPESELDLIFDPFHRVPDHSSRVDGTGVGLSIVKKNIELMNGDVKVTSTVEEGSCFSVVLPAQAPSEKEVASHFEI